MWQTLKNYGYTMNQTHRYMAPFLERPCHKGGIVISHMRNNEQLADIFMKPLNEKRFQELRSELNIIDSHNLVWKIAHLKWCTLISILSSFYVEKSSYAQ
jgi:hypothetical protein